MKRGKVTSVLTSRHYYKYYKNKEEKKREKELRKENKRLKREQAKKIKMEKLDKPRKTTKKQTNVTIDQDSTSASDYEVQQPESYYQRREGELGCQRLGFYSLRNQQTKTVFWWTDKIAVKFKSVNQVLGQGSKYVCV